MNFNLHLHPGPRDDSLLYLGAEHRSRKLFLNPQEGDMCTIDFKRGDAAFWEPVINEIITFPSNVLKYIDLFGFGGVLRCTYRRLDRALIEALIERWRPETNTFHMPFGEVTVTLEDVNVLWGLPVEGIALSWHEESFSNDQRVQMCHTYLGLYTDRKNFKSHMLKLSTLIEFMKDYPVTDDSTDEECIQRARCICLILATKTVLPDTNNAHVPLHLLTHLTDFNISGQMSWGAASLACLYRELYKGTMPDTSAIGGPMALLQIWAWTRIRSMAPTIVDPIIDWNSPYGSRWADHDLNTTETPTHVIKAQRQTLQKLQKDDFDWMPYRHVMRRLPPMCRTGINSWRSNCFLIYWNVVEYHPVERVMRQFGFIHTQGGVIGTPGTRTNTFLVTSHIGYTELVENICRCVQIDRQSSSLGLTLYYEYNESSFTSSINKESDMYLIYQLATLVQGYTCKIHVTWTTIVPNLNQHEYGGSSTIEENDQDSPAEELEDTEQSEASLSEYESEDDEPIPPLPEQQSQGLTHFPGLNVEGRGMDQDYIPLDNFGEDEMEFWDEKDPEIRLNMYFISKDQADYAIRMWNISHNREIFMADSRPRVLVAKCKSIKKTNNNLHLTSQPCLWTCTARKLKDSNCFKMTIWTPAHSCFTTVARNNNMALRSKVVASHIQEQLLADLSYPVKQIQSLIKEKLNVDITYGKAWAARKKAIDNIYGTWDENFHELPSYIMALQQANPGTVVQWLHHPNSPSDYSVFKYVFWAFKPSIEAFTYCIPVISIDATHLRGTYKGKILMAVSKNANNMILAIAYALVDEETNQSWKWFLQMFAENVEDPSRRTLCVISDRHLGIKHAMENLQSWKHPNAYHRYCLRHVRSNFMAKFKNVSLKRMCWEIGSTTQQRKYERLMDALKVTNKQAWQYLNGIDKTKWTRLFDNNNRRWGILTTNISESMNNVLRGARMLPIRALIEYTFKREVEQYAIHYTTADNCSTEFPPRMWTLFHTREIRARQHRVYPYSARHQRFMVETPLQTSDESGHSPYTVEFEKKTCSCGKWQIFRFPCSHAIAVCHHLRKNPSTISDQRFLTPTYRAQYNNQYFPVAHKEDWWYAGWRIIADSSKITIVRGRRRARRMHNEMDATYAEERTGRRCSGCKNVGHRINACPYRQN